MRYLIILFSELERFRARGLFTILLTFLFTLPFSGLANAETWFCKKINKDLSECRLNKIFTENKITNKSTAIFIGETKNNFPSGNGKISFILNGKKVDEFFKGFFVLGNDNNLGLDTGEWHVNNAIYFAKNKKFYKVQYKNGNIFEGTFYIAPGPYMPFEGTFYNNSNSKGDIYKGTFTKQGNYLDGTYFHKDGSKTIVKNSVSIETTKSSEITTYILFLLVPLIIFVIYKLSKGSKSIDAIINTPKLVLNKYGIKNRGDYSVLIICIVVLGPGTLIILSWVSKLLGIYGVSKFVNSIFNANFFIVYIYLIFSTLASIIWWGFIIIEKFFSKDNK